MSITEKASITHQYHALPTAFYHPVQAMSVPHPKLVALNTTLAETLGIQTHQRDHLALWLTGQEHHPAHLAMAYAGHQFGQLVPQLGDGRALLIGEVITPTKQCYEIHLKGSGATPFSRRGDGKASLSSMLREYLISEAMHHLKIKTSRSLAVCLTQQTIQREQTLPGAILTRICQSLIRVGTFEYFAVRHDHHNLSLLLSFVIKRCYPALQTAKNPALALLKAVIAAQANLIAQWQSIGFIHGVMNTDNMAISAETIDYGPCAFMDEYHPNQVFSRIDRYGRYAYQQQPVIGHWNLTCLASCLLPLIDNNLENAKTQAQDELAQYQAIYQHAWLKQMAAKFGILKPESKDQMLIQNWLDFLATNKIDFTNGFRSLTQLVDHTSTAHLDMSTMQTWHQAWLNRLNDEADPATIKQRLNRTNPIFIPRNHHVQHALEMAQNHADFNPFKRLLNVLKSPFKASQAHADLTQPPSAQERIPYTECGT